MSTKGNPGTLPMNLYLTEQPKSQPFDFGKIGEVQGETTETVLRGQVNLSSRVVTLSCLRYIILQNEIVRIAARCNHCYQKSKGNVL